MLSKKGLHFLLVSILALLFSCHESNPTPTFEKININKTEDFLVFGEIYSDCQDDCRKLYLLADNELYADADDQVELENTTFKIQALPYESFLMSRGLLDVPTVLVEQNYAPEDLIDYISDRDFYIYGQREGISFQLTYDAIDLSAPEALKDYGKLVQNTLNHLNQ